MWCTDRIKAQPSGDYPPAIDTEVYEISAGIKVPIGLGTRLKEVFQHE